MLLFYSEGCILLNENNSYFEIQKKKKAQSNKKNLGQTKMPLMY